MIHWLDIVLAQYAFVVSTTDSKKDNCTHLEGFINILENGYVHFHNRDNFEHNNNKNSSKYDNNNNIKEK